ncbi:MAG: SPOR domain-containing protein [Tannerella sp.]|jgi:hypothetical protein|nr:SPOR domain-containing protein [Tannerella sp.]
MLRILSHIERLLLFNDCVIIPDLGGFVLQIHTAVIGWEEHMFRPPYKDIVFNPTLKHNDGLLIESYMQLYDMDYNEAQTAMKSDVDALKKKLDENEIIRLGRAGKFRKVNKVLLFEPGNDIAVFNVSSYGLIPFYLPPAQRESEESVIEDGQLQSEESSTVEASSERTVALLPVKKVLSGVIGIAAAAGALFLLISTPIKEVNKSAYTANFLPAKIVNGRQDFRNDFLETGVSVSGNETAEEVMQISDETLPLAASIPDHDPDFLKKETVTAQINNSFTLKTEVAVPKTFYVIIGSFASENELNKFLAKAVPVAFKNMGVVKNDKRIRVYADKTTDRKEAEAYMLLLRENEKYKDAWLFIGR